MHPEVDRFAQLESPIHRWDPRWKIVAFSALVLAFGFVGDEARLRPSWQRDLPPALVALAVSIALVKLSAIPFRVALRTLRPALLFLAILLVILPTTYPSELENADGALSIGPLVLSSRGLLVAILIGLRAFAIVLLVFPMFGTTPFHDSMRALRRLKVPGPLVQLISFTYRYVFVLADEVRRMQIAWRARGFQKRLDIHTVRTLGNGVGMLVIGSMERSRRIFQAMTSRGYSGEFRTAAELRTRPRDVLKAAIVCGFAVLFFAWRTW